MKLIKHFILVVILVGFVIYAKNSSKLTFSDCDKVINYVIGNIDPEYDFTSDEILKLSKESASIWNAELGKDYFVYNPNSKNPLKIHFDYDERQALLTNIGAKDSTIAQEQQRLKQEIQDYQERENELSQKIIDLNDEIAYWNSQGGAPEDVYEDLTQERDEIQQEINDSNQAVANLNAQIEHLNQTIEDLNLDINSFNAQISERPEEGIYNPNTNEIIIFFYSTEADLRHTLSHEFGHAIGLGHNMFESTLMNPITNETTELTEHDKNMLTNYCVERNLFEYINHQLGLFQEYYLL